MPKRGYWLTSGEVGPVILPDGMPWTPHSPQVNGSKGEKQAAKRLGARVHPRSGAGIEKDDYSTDEVIYEHKEVAKSHTLSGIKLLAQLRRALQQGKESRYIVYFKDSDVTLEGVLRRGR